jgi:hypothetical protein
MAQQPDPATSIQATSPDTQPQPPVNRRRALRLLGTLTVAAAGAAALTASRTEIASANPPVQGTGTATAAGVEGDNTMGGPGVLGDITGSPPSTWITAGVWGRIHGRVFLAVEPGRLAENVSRATRSWPILPTSNSRHG